MSSEFSDFFSSEIPLVNFDVDQCNKTLIHQSNHYTTFKFKSQNRWFCIKQINVENVNNYLFISSLENEFKIGFELNHPNTIQYYSYGINKDGNYLIKEYIDGIPLKEYFESIISNSIFFKELKRISNELLDFLSYLHKKQIYHLDLKPSNILITTKGNNLKVIDFGLSIIDNQDYYNSGTIDYASPEQLFDSNQIDGRSDIYAFGKILENLVLTRKKSSIFNVFHLLKFKKIIRKSTQINLDLRYKRIVDLTSDLNSKLVERLFLVISITILFVLFSYYFSLNIKNTELNHIEIKNNSSNNLIFKGNLNQTKIEKIKKQLIRHEDYNQLSFNKIESNDLNSEKIICLKVIDSLVANYHLTLSFKSNKNDSLEAYYRLYNLLQINHPTYIPQLKNSENMNYLELFYDSIKFQKLKVIRNDK